MIRWAPYTFVRTTFFFIAGITLAVYFPNLIAPEIFVPVLLSGVFLFTLLFFTIDKQRSLLFGMLSLMVVFVLGYAHTAWQHPKYNARHIQHSHDSVAAYEVVLTRFTESKANSWKVEAQITNAYAHRWKRSAGGVVLYFAKRDFKTPFRYGDVLVIKGRPQPVPSPTNPGEFDYRKHLSYRQIYHQHFLKEKDVTFVRYDAPSRIMALAIDARIACDSVLSRAVTGDRERSIASALILGITDGLDNELLGAYAATGAMHVLAVSGLHVSIIYMILIFLLKPFTQSRQGPWIVFAVSVVVLWSYAFITGLSPSVLRAVVMFSFVALARPMKQNTNIYNTLAASAFCILLFDPFLIMSVGFQLSYLAVIGILYYQRPLYKLWEPRQRFWDEVWKITTVSIAAQLVTFPLGLLYFHQFPNYFVLSNLLVIPASFLVLVLGLFVLAIGWWPFLVKVSGWCLTMSIKLLNLMVFAVEGLPFALFENVFLSVFECWLLCLVIVMATLLTVTRKFYWTAAILGLVLMMAAVRWSYFSDRLTHPSLIVYNISGHHAFELASSGRSWFFADSALHHSKSKIKFHVQPNRLLSGIKTVSLGEKSDFVVTFPGAAILRWRRNTILHIHGSLGDLPPELSPDVMIISNDAVKDFEIIIKNKALVILDSSNSYFYNKRLKAFADGVGVTVYSVAEQGAYIAQLR